jgi:hypothetical protein
MVKWATAIYKGILFPTFHIHYRYFQKKAQLDRILEQLHPMWNVGLGILFGTVLYLIITPLRPNGIDKSLKALQVDLVEALSKMHVDFRQEFYPFAINRVRTEIVSRALVARDEAEAKRQMKEQEELKMQVKQELEKLKEKKATGNAI